VLQSTGSGLNSKSYLFISTPPMDNKLDVIVQALYAFNRIFYVDLQGNFCISPLQNYFDTDNSWYLDYSGNASDLNLGALNTDVYVPGAVINVNKTADKNNRVFCILMQAQTKYVLANATGTTNDIPVAQSVITPPQDLFPREYDMVESGLGLQSIVKLQQVNGDAAIQNGGLINTAIGITSGSIQGLYSKMVIDGKSLSYLTQDEEDQYRDIKYLTALYGARALAEELHETMLVTASMPIKYTFSNNLGNFRQIPINQLVKMPSVNNDLFDGQQALFCYGFSIEVNGYASILTLKLCKPFTYTALWCDQVQLIDQTTFG
jgi:hypothetical protein